MSEGFRAPIRFKSQSYYPYENRETYEVPNFRMRFGVGGGDGDVTISVRPDGTIVALSQDSLVDAKSNLPSRLPVTEDSETAWTLFRQLKMPGRWKISLLENGSEGMVVWFSKLVNGLAVINLNPGFRYSLTFDKNKVLVSLYGIPELPPVSDPESNISAEQAQETLETYYRGTKQGIFSPQWPHKVTINPELCYYKFSKEDKARLVWVGHQMQTLFNRTESEVGKGNMLVDAVTGELVRADDPGWN